MAMALNDIECLKISKRIFENIEFNYCLNMTVYLEDVELNTRDRN